MAGDPARVRGRRPHTWTSKPALPNDRTTARAARSSPSVTNTDVIGSYGRRATQLFGDANMQSGEQGEDVIRDVVPGEREKKDPAA